MPTPFYSYILGSASTPEEILASATAASSMVATHGANWIRITYEISRASKVRLVGCNAETEPENTDDMVTEHEVTIAAPMSAPASFLWCVAGYRWVAVEAENSDSGNAANATVGITTIQGSPAYPPAA